MEHLPTTTKGPAVGTGVFAIAGVAAGALFLGSSVIQGLTRHGFRLSQQPISFLCLGQLGWLEQLTFITAGVLLATCALGMRQRRPRLEGRLEALSVALIGLGLVIAGLFPPDPGFGYPVGTPDGPPRTITYHSQLHGVGFTVAFVSFVLACIVDIRSSSRRHAWPQVSYTAASAAAAMILALTPGTGGIALRDLSAALILWAWVTQRAVRLARAERTVAHVPPGVRWSAQRLGPPSS